MISRTGKSISLRAGDQRVAARMALGLVAAVLCLLLVLAGASLGMSGSLAFSQPSPSGSASAPSTEPSIFLLNPNPTTDPHFTTTEPPREPSDPENPTADPDPPKISDEYDGTDGEYHVVAVVNNPPSNILVEAYYAADGENEVTVGQLSPVPGSNDTYELFWDIDEDTIAAGFGMLTVRMYSQTASGFDEIAAHEVEVRMQHFDSLNLFEPIIEEAETVELVWPSQNGPLGFYKSAGAAGVWRTIVNGTTSVGVPGESTPAGTQGNRNVYQVRLYYSATPIGADPPEFKLCGTVTPSGARPDNSRTFAGACGLLEDDLPSQVTAIAAMAVQDQEPDDPGTGAGGVNVRDPSQEGLDAHRVRPYTPDPDELKISLHTQPTGDAPARRHDVAGVRCQTMVVSVTDVLDRPVQGANVDVHVTGPDDQMRFGEDSTNASNASSGKQPPDKVHPSKEFMADCDANDNGVGFPVASQGDHNVPGGDDTKHLESSAGTGLSSGGGLSFGQWRFHLYSSSVGDNDILAWIDDEALPSPTEKRPADDDLPETLEPQDTNFAQWLPAAVAVTIDPAGATAAAGECHRFVIRVRGGNRPVRAANVDVHATGPDNELDFCDPSDASPRRAPEQGVGHVAEDQGEVAHSGQPPVAQHTEGETSDQGNFVVGLRSPIPGDTNITAWYDSGETPFDNDELAAGEASGTATTNWVASTADSAISFVNPSPYGPGGEGARVSNKLDADSGYHLVARTSSVQPVPGVEFLIRTGTEPLAKIADGTQISSTDTWETYWNADVAEGSHTLVARILGTTIQVEQAITVNNDAGTDPRDVPDESAEITAPLNGARASFTRGKVTITGVTSAGSEGVDLYYTKASALGTPQTAAWISCGFAPSTSGSAPKEFSGECTLAGADQPAQVTGVAVLPYDCIQAGCNAAPGGGPGGVRNPGARDSGDAHRVFGSEANPLISLEPAETANPPGGCTRFVLNLTDQTGQPMGEENVDVHLSGPADEAGFCDPGDGTASTRRAPDQGAHTPDGNEPGEGYHQEAGRVHHTEAETNANGRFIFGVHSDSDGDATVDVWLDVTDNDVQEESEPTDRSIVHWETEGQPSACDIAGTPGDDTLIGTAAGERICGAGGNDVIKGRGGNDVLVGAAGNDHLRGNAGNDVVRGNAGNDRVFGGGGSDRVLGGSGNDRVGGNKANDRLRGHGGRDRLNGGLGRDSCNGGRGRDRSRNCESSAARATFARRTRLI